MDHIVYGVAALETTVKNRSVGGRHAIHEVRMECKANGGFLQLSFGFLIEGPRIVSLLESVKVKGRTSVSQEQRRSSFGLLHHVHTPNFEGKNNKFT